MFHFLQLLAGALFHCICGGTDAGYDCIRRNLQQGLQHECAPVHLRMRDRQAVLMQMYICI